MGIEMSQSNQDPIGNNWKEFDLDEVRESGWYAVHYGWNPEEGSWVKAINFDGGVFEESLPLLHISSRGFRSECEAIKWCEKNDISQ
jgi:hypothetical protein